MVHSRLPNPLKVLLEDTRLSTNVAELVENCIVLDRVSMSLDEYRLRLSSLLGASFQGAPQIAGRLSDVQSSGYTLGESRVSPQLLQLDCGKEAKMPDRKLLDMLGLLVERAPAVVTVEEFLDSVWSGTVVGDNSVHRAISRLRKAFRADPKDATYIETIAKSGYRLITPVSLHETVQHGPPSHRVASPFYVQLKKFVRNRRCNKRTGGMELARGQSLFVLFARAD